MPKMINVGRTSFVHFGDRTKVTLGWLGARGLGLPSGTIMDGRALAARRVAVAGFRDLYLFPFNKEIPLVRDLNEVMGQGGYGEALMATNMSMGVRQTFKEIAPRCGFFQKDEEELENPKKYIARVMGEIEAELAQREANFWIKMTKSEGKPLALMLLDTPQMIDSLRSGRNRAFWHLSILAGIRYHGYLKNLLMASH
ncbi:MAG: hypothetical protein V1843_01705 [bacterium]